MLTGGAPTQTAAPPAAGDSAPIDDEGGQFVEAVLKSTETVWGTVFREQLGRSYTEPRLVLFTDAVPSACGTNSSAVGPFYCPPDQRVYIDLSFYDELDRRFGAPGDFAQAYVIAHEVGHHVQNLLGIDEKVRAAQQRGSEAQANQLSVRMELQADCFAGVWGHYVQAQTAADKVRSSRATSKRACAPPPRSATTPSSARRRAGSRPRRGRTARRSSACSGCAAASTPARSRPATRSVRICWRPLSREAAAALQACGLRRRAGRAAAPCARR